MLDLLLHAEIKNVNNGTEKSGEDNGPLRQDIKLDAELRSDDLAMFFHDQRAYKQHLMSALWGAGGDGHNTDVSTFGISFESQHIDAKFMPDDGESFTVQKCKLNHIHVYKINQGKTVSVVMRLQCYPSKQAAGDIAYLQGDTIAIKLTQMQNDLLDESGADESEEENEAA